MVVLSCFSHIRSNNNIKMAFCSASVSLWRHASIADGCGPAVNVPLGVAGSFVISSMSSGPSIGLVACMDSAVQQ